MVFIKTSHGIVKILRDITVFMDLMDQENQLLLSL